MTQVGQIALIERWESPNYEWQAAARAGAGCQMECSNNEADHWHLIGGRYGSVSDTHRFGDKQGQPREVKPLMMIDPAGVTRDGVPLLRVMEQVGPPVPVPDRLAEATTAATFAAEGLRAGMLRANDIVARGGWAIPSSMVYDVSTATEASWVPQTTRGGMRYPAPQWSDVGEEAAVSDHNPTPVEDDPPAPRLPF